MDRRTLVLIFAVALALCAAITKTHVVSWNDGSRFATVDALTAGHRFEIDGSPYAVSLGDKIRFHGRTYSDKPPLLAVLGAGVALLLAPLGISLRHAPAAAIYLVTLLTVGVWFAIGCCYAYAFQRRLGFERRTAAAVAALTGAGTLALPYASVLANHVPCGASALAACYHLVRARDGGALHALLAGVFFGLAFAFDATGALFAIAAVVLLWGAPWQHWLSCIGGGVPFVVLQVAYNKAISGSVIPTVFNAQVWNDPSLPLHAWAGQIGQTFSPAVYLGFVVNLLVGARGLFSFTPLMLVAAYGFAVMWREGGLPRRIAIAVLATSAVFFVMIVVLQNDTEARNFGERRYVDLFFLLCIALGPALASVRGTAARVLVRVAVALSVAIAALGTVAPFAGEPGESGFAFAPVAFAALMRRTPVQGAVDVLLLIAMIVLVLRLLPPPAQARSVTAAAPRRG